MVYPSHSDTNVPLSHPISRWALLIVGALVVYWIAIFVGTHLPGDPLGPLASRGGDKWIHCGAFAGLAILLALAVGWFSRPGWLSYLAMFAGLALYGAIDEWTQSFVGRSTDLKDWIADVIGITLGLSVYAIVAWMWPRVDESSLDEATSRTEGAEDRRA